MRTNFSRVWIPLILIGLLAPLSLAAPKKAKTLDKIWVHTSFASFGLEKIVILPIATFDNSLEAEKTVEATFSQVFKQAGYRWVSATTSRDLLRSRAGGRDSLVRVIKDELLKADRVDSLRATELCGWLRADAVLSLRVDLWERQQVEWNQPGKSSTSVQVRASLVDSLGRVLWTASGSQRGEGSYNDPNAGVSGVTVSGLDTKPITAQAGAPQFTEVCLPLFTRWFEQFPAKGAGGGSGSGAPSPPASGANPPAAADSSR